MTTIEELKQTNNEEDNHKERNGIMRQIQTEVSNRSVIHVVSIQKEQTTKPSSKGGTITMVPFKNVTVIKSLVPKGPIVNADNKGNMGNADVYEKRKRLLPEYKELFAALMKLSDKDMQKKLLSVINSHSHQTEYRSVETQTNSIELKEATTITDFNSNEMSNEVSSPMTELTNSNSNTDTKTTNENLITGGEVIKKRKRKRKVSLPQANKESRAKQLAKLNKPKTVVTNGKGSEAAGPVEENFNLIPRKLRRMESLCISECISDISNTVEDTQIDNRWEWEHSDCPLENGLWPIQDAVVRNQINKLSYHIHIQQEKGRDLNDIITEEDEDLLQLSVLNTCDPSIVNLLLEKNLNPNTLDADSNTIVHLAILNDITVESLEHLMKRIELKLLLTLNDDGYTPLHLAVRQDRFLLAECLINVLDERLVNKVFYKRQLDKIETDENLWRKQFKDYYEKVCLHMINDEEDAITIDNHNLKQQLLQAGDRRGGNTALYFAIDNRYEHLIYFLLAHLTDPRTENLSGLDCKTYFSEYGKSLNLSLNIDNAMEKVIKLLS